jgi:hypothetical protein
MAHDLIATALLVAAVLWLFDLATGRRSLRDANGRATRSLAAAVSVAAVILVAALIVLLTY